MIAQDFEDWLMGVTLAVAVAGTIGAHALTMPIASDAVASTLKQPQYHMTVTAKRLPAACKTAHAPASCAAYLDGETTVTVVER